MIIKLLFYAAVLAIGCKLVLGRWPWEYLQGPVTRQQALNNARKLLGISANASRSEISEAHRRLLISVHPDRGGSNDLVHEATAARDLLLDTLPPES